MIEKGWLRAGPFLLERVGLRVRLPLLGRVGIVRGPFCWKGLEIIPAPFVRGIGNAFSSVTVIAALWLRSCVLACVCGMGKNAEMNA